MMNNRLTPDEKDFLKLFTKEAAVPDPKFKAALKREMFNTFSEKKSFFGFLTSPQFAVVSLSVLILLTTIGGLSFLSILSGKKDTTTSTKVFSESETNNILENVIKSNSVNVLAKAQPEVLTPAVTQPTTPVNMQTTVPEAPTVAPPVITKPENSDYNYRYTKITTTAGPAKDVCRSIAYFPEKTSQSESYEYFTDTVAYHKFIASNSDGSLTDYVLSKSGENNAETLEYKGGDFAVKIKYDYSNGNIASYPASSPTEVQQTTLIKNFFGNNAQVLTNNSSNSDYIVQDVQSVDCDLVPAPVSFPTSYTDQSIPDTKTLIYQYYIDNQTFEVKKVEIYVDSVSFQNLVGSTETQIEKRTVDKNTIDRTFSFEYPAQIKEIQFTNSDVPAQDQLNEYLNLNNMDVVKTDDYQIAVPLDQTALALPSLKYTWFLYVRDFYPDNAVGEQSYQQSIKSLGDPAYELLYNLKKDDKTIESKVFSKTTSDENIFAQYSIELSNIKQTTIKLDGADVSANYLEIQNCDNNTKCMVMNTILIIQTASKKIALNLDGNIADWDLTFDSVNSTNLQK